MSPECPSPDCGYESKSGRGIAIHWSRSSKHTGVLSEHYPDYDTSSTEQHGQATSEGLEGNTLTEEHKKKISEFQTGYDNVSEEARERIAEMNKGNNYASGYERTEEQKAALERGRKGSSTEWNENISESMKGNNNRRRTAFFVDELGHEVDSNWEMDLAFLLQSHNIDYEREPCFDKLDGGSYFPDFQVEDFVIEVKGYADDYSIEKAEEFLSLHDNYVYIVVGDKMPSDVHIGWEDREELVVVLGTRGRDMRARTVIE